MEKNISVFGDMEVDMTRNVDLKFQEGWTLFLVSKLHSSIISKMLLFRKVRSVKTFIEQDCETWIFMLTSALP